ncbi:MAG: DHH family phosphoesterase [Clostridia bacterium]|nr:DHH family phosphoesterase [Clostridia bacterium]
MYNKKEKRSVYRTLAEIISLILCASCCALGALWASRSPENLLLISIIMVLGAISLSIFTMLGFSSLEKKRKVHGPTGPVLGSIMYDVVNSASEPALICDEQKKIIWFNRFAQDASGVSGSLLGKSLSLIMQNPLPEGDDKNEKEIITTLGERTYRVEVTKISSAGKLYSLLIFRDITELARLQKFVCDDEKIIAYIIVDNLEELLQFEQENYREASGKIETEMRAWANEVNGIIKEYEKDKYIFIFRNEDLEKFIENKFEILDKIRNIRVGSGFVPVTISIGVAKIKGTLADKERAAHAALDMALQRGGDQAVVKFDENISFFGGKTSTVHKRTKVPARVAGSKLVSLMASASNVIIMGHKYPDYDAFGASVGLARLAMICGVKVNVVTDPKNPNIKRCMKFFDEYKYKGLFVDSARGLDLIKSETLLVIADVNNPDMFESIDIYNNVYNIAIIDHHRKTAESERKLLIEYIDPASSSTCELVAEMLEQCLPMTTLEAVEANMLLAGISLDTKQFTKGTGPKTYGAAMYLLDNNASYEAIQDLFKTNIIDYRQISKFGQKVEMYRNCTAIAVNYEVGDASTDRALVAKVADSLLSVEGVSASFALMQIDDTVHISARSNGSVNVQLILERLKGGGRYDSAGAQIKSASIQQTLVMLKDAIDDYFNVED